VHELPAAVTRDFLYDHEVRGVLMVAVLLGACEPNGLTLEVTTKNPAVTRVELLPGMDCPDNCPERVAPPALDPRPIDHIFVVDDSSPWFADVEGGVAGFRVTVDNPASVGMLLAIGLDKDGQPLETVYAYDVEIPTTRGDYVRVALKPAAPVATTLLDPPQPDGAEGLAIWREPVAKRACVLAEHWNGNPEPQRDLIVPSDDTDCDEVVPAKECAPWTPLAMNAPSTIDNANCTYFGALPSGADVCLFGGTPCNELSPTTTPQCTHLEEKYCTPKALCTSCTGVDWSPDCAANALVTGAMQQSLPFLDCSFRVTEAGIPCVDQLTVTGVDLSGLLGANRVSSCERAGVHDLTAPFGPFDNKVQTPTGLFKVDGLTQPCKLDILWKGTAVTPGSVTPPSAVFLDLDLDNTNHLVLPAVIRTEVGCTNQPRCVLALGTAGDTMLQCARERGTMTAICGPSGLCANGPSCGTSCCGAGEECINNVCTCGGKAGCDGGDVCTAGAYGPDQCGSLCCGVNTLCPF